MDSIADWINMICRGVLVNKKTGEAYLTPYHYNDEEGCICLAQIIKDKNHTVHIHPLDSPKEDVPGSRTAPNKPDKKIGSCNGGATVPSSLDNASSASDGSVGSGSNTDVYIDMSNNNGHGYRIDINSGGGVTGAPAELYVILAHELTTGHAYHCITGTLPHPTGNEKVDEAARERQAIDSENNFRKQHSLPTRHISNSGGG